MASTVEPAPHTRPPAPDELARSSIGELTRLYREARAPSSIEALSGPFRGHVLAVAGVLGRAPGRAALLVWRGKTFEAFDERAGQGINRLHGLGERYRFEVELGGSVLDGRRCLILDYDVPDNPRPLRRIREELRELRPGVFFGPALVRTRTEPKLVLFVALSFAEG